MKYKTPLTNEIKKIMHCRTIGIIDRVIKLFMAVQLEAIISKIETITPELINEVADEKFPLTEEMINAFKSSNIDKIGQYEDIKAQDLALSSYINRNLVNEKILEIYKSEKFEQNKIKEATINDIIFRICILTSYKKEEVKNAAVAFCNINGFNKDIDFLIREVYKILVERENGVSKNEKISHKKENKKNAKVPNNFDESKTDILNEFGEGLV